MSAPTHPASNFAVTKMARRASPDYQKAWFSFPAVLLIFGVFVIPLIIVVVQSLTHGGFTFDGYRKILQSGLFWRVFWVTVQITGWATVVCVLLSYPLAYFISQLRPSRRAIAMIFVLLPFWTSILVKSFGFIVVLGDRGFVKTVMLELFSWEIETPLMFSRIGVVIGMVHFLIPFCVFPVVNNLLAQPSELRRAALVMGSNRRQAFFRVTLPLSLPAIVAGAVMSAVLSMSVFVTPALLGGRRDMMVANLIDYYTREVLDWNAAAALSVVLLVFSGILIWILSTVDNENKQ